MCVDIYQMVAKNRIPNKSSFASHPLHATVPASTGTLFLIIFSSFLLFFIEALVAQWLHAWDSGVDDLQYRFDIR